MHLLTVDTLTLGIGRVQRLVTGTHLMFVSSEGVQQIFSDYAQKYLE